MISWRHYLFLTGDARPHSQRRVSSSAALPPKPQAVVPSSAVLSCQPPSALPRSIHGCQSSRSILSLPRTMHSCRWPDKRGPSHWWPYLRHNSNSQSRRTLSCLFLDTNRCEAKALQKKASSKMPSPAKVSATIQAQSPAVKSDQSSDPVSEQLVMIDAPTSSESMLHPCSQVHRQIEKWNKKVMLVHSKNQHYPSGTSLLPLSRKSHQLKPK